MSNEALPSPHLHYSITSLPSQPLPKILPLVQLPQSPATSTESYNNNHEPCDRLPPLSSNDQTPPPNPPLSPPTLPSPSSRSPHLHHIQTCGLRIYKIPSVATRPSLPQTLTLTKSAINVTLYMCKFHSICLFRCQGAS
ncbi:hypothetical protein L211DRAFT_709913 [Terfezia boudieri ATCC MYA-4762]|uniref:Uncharacterized protein n=1 Tax=Terfezia boudieri ATCC MYA-4762 TaxID=1051890 RepID=A0A3N4LTS7_9PEZI|nr:hypothetical protein L211DRAFT_709913 [Terfezia boudieri ATCC MYA-4762]